MAAPHVMPINLRRNRFDPAAELAENRSAQGVLRFTTFSGAQAHLVTRHADIRAVLADTERFSNAGMSLFAPPDATPEEQARLTAGLLLAFDPPDHTRLRRLLTGEFTVKRMRSLEPRVAEIVDQHLDAMAAAGPPADLVAGFALPVPSLVICELLGVPFADRAAFQGRTRQLLDVALPPAERAAVGTENRAYMAELVARAQAEPGDDLLGMLVSQHGAELSTDELTGIAVLLLTAGHETTASMLGIGTLALLQHPEQLAAVRDDPAAVEPAVEELLRFLSIANGNFPRTTTAEVEIAGHVIPKGELVMVALPTGNRDPEFVERPDELDITRGAPGHLAFGHGVHHCLGAPLARMEMRIAFPRLLQRFPTLACAVPFEEVPFRATSAVYGLEALPVTW